MFKFKRNLMVMLGVGICCVFIHAQTQTYYVSAAGGCANPNASPDAKGFYDTVSGYSNWSGNFYVKYTAVKETDYKSSVYGGLEHTVIDVSNIHYHVSHGGDHDDANNGNSTLTAIVFMSTGDTKYLDSSEAASSWGDKNLDWIAFRCCKLLNDASKTYWAETMQGLHLLLGFKTVSSKDNTFGTKWASKMSRRVFNGDPISFVIPAQTICQAWFSTVDETQSSDVVARVIGETLQCKSDYLYGFGTVCSDPTPDNTKNYWDHQACPPPNFHYVNDLIDVIRKQVIPVIINTETVHQIGKAFGFDEEDEVFEWEDKYVMTRPDDLNPDPDNPIHLLYVYKNSGMYYYHNLSRLWKIDHDNPSIPGIYPESGAQATAYNFLTDPSHINLYPNDVHTYSLGSDEIVEKNTDTGTEDVYPVNRCVTYWRELEAHQGTNVSVVGPGARLKVYIDENGSIMGAMGNWREVQDAGSIDIMTKQAAWNLFVQNGQEAAINPIYLEYDNVQTDMNTAVVGYYESSPSETQTELIPVWIFNATYYQGGEEVLTAYAYIPAEI